MDTVKNNDYLLQLNIMTEKGAVITQVEEDTKLLSWPIWVLKHLWS